MVESFIRSLRHRRRRRSTKQLNDANSVNVAIENEFALLDELEKKPISELKIAPPPPPVIADRLLAPEVANGKSAAKDNSSTVAKPQQQQKKQPTEEKSPEKEEEGELVGLTEGVRTLHSALFGAFVCARPCDVQFQLC